jgi:hypothetical protein
LWPVEDVDVHVVRDFGDRRHGLSIGAQAPALGFFTPPPAVLGQTFDGPMEGHAPGMPWHYDVHVWVAEANPSGVFAQFNPAISC